MYLRKYQQTSTYNFIDTNSEYSREVIKEETTQSLFKIIKISNLFSFKEK